MAASAAMQLKVICTLRHQEIGNLFGVCKELRSTVSIPHCPLTCHNLTRGNTYITDGWTVPLTLALFNITAEAHSFDLLMTKCCH